MSQRKARPAVAKTVHGRNGQAVSMRPTTAAEVKEEVDRIIRVIVDSIPNTPGGNGPNPLAVLAAIEGARLTFQLQVDDLFAGNPEERELFDQQLAKIVGLLRPLDPRANAAGGIG